jgi:hypothetical protein
VSSHWTLYAPAPEGLPAPEIPAWLQELNSTAERLGGESEFLRLPEVQSGGYACALLEGYIALSSVVGGFFSNGNEHVLVLMQKGSPDCVPQPGLVQGTCKAALQIPLTATPVNREELIALFNDAYVHLLRAGHLQ